MLLYSILNNKTTFKSEYLEDTIYNLLDQTFVLPKKGFDYNVFEVSEEYIARPDLISYDAYGDTMFTDVICKINGISNPFELNAGMKLILPSPDYILDFAIIPSFTESEKENKPTPVAKVRQEKRKPNEAIIGDSRFKIDPASGVIIY